MSLYFVVYFTPLRWLRRLAVWGACVDCFYFRAFGLGIEIGRRRVFLREGLP